MDAKQVIEWFNMQPNTVEGGYYYTTYTSTLLLDSKELPGFKPIKERRRFN